MMPDESSPETLPRHVFVYGTLRQTGSNDITRLQPAPRFIGRAVVAGVLYHLGAYPGLVLARGESADACGGSESNRGAEVQGELLSHVQGEVYAITPALESILDEIEGLGAHPTDEYTKRDIAVTVHGQTRLCLVYEINPRYVASARAIGHGDWLLAVHGG